MHHQEVVESTPTPTPHGIALALTAGVAIGGKLREAHLVEMTETGLVFRAELSKERWLELMRVIHRMGRVRQSYLADAIKAGTAWFGDEYVMAAMEQLEFDMAELGQAVSIGKLVDGARLAKLRSDQLYAISKANLPPLEQARWATLAVEHGLNAAVLAKCIAAGKLNADDAGVKHARNALVTIHAVRQMFDTWFGRMEQERPIEKLPEEDARELWDELEAPTRVGVALAKRLGIELGK